MAEITRLDLELALRDCMSGTERTEDFRDAIRAATVLPPNEVKDAVLNVLRAKR